MRNSETGEYELVMGNRQLLSGFFIVALLFGVAFAMGYIVGRNSSPASKTQADASQPGSTIDQRPPAVGYVAPTASEPPKTEAAPAPSATTPPVEATAPPTAAPPAAAAPEKPAEAAPASSASDPPPGSYWQVIAARQAEAETVQKALRERGFAAHLTPGPNGLVRVIIGPYSDRESLGKAKADLENAGFRPHLVKR
jgi:cell division septation protein DedD